MITTYGAVSKAYWKVTDLNLKPATGDQVAMSKHCFLGAWAATFHI